MPRKRRLGPDGTGPLARISGLALTAGAVGLTGLALAGCQPTSPAASPASTASAHAAAVTASPRLSIPGTHQSTTVYRIRSAVSKVVVVSRVGNVTIVGGGGSTASVTEQVAYSRTPPVTTRTITGKTLTVTYTCPPQLACGVAYVVQVPRNVAVQVTAGAGSIRLSGVAGSVTARTRIGFINAVNLAGAWVSLTTDVGGIGATFETTPIAIQALAKVGAITLRVPSTASYKISVSARLGQATVNVPQSSSSAHAITASTDVGGILIASPA
jgi:hypothetical protein